MNTRSRGIGWNEKDVVAAAKPPSASGCGRATRRGARRGVLAGLVLAALLALAIAPGARAQWVGGGMGSAGQIMACKQLCFENYLANVERCEAIFCIHVLWLTLTCDDAGLAQCKLNAQAVFYACIAKCGGV